MNVDATNAPGPCLVRRLLGFGRHLARTRLATMAAPNRFQRQDHPPSTEASRPRATVLNYETASTREHLSRRYLRGSGIEVGALHTPLPVFEGATVTYVDRLPRDELLRHYPELASDAQHIVEPQVLDDGEELTTIRDRSQDFLIANHFLEHCENPLRTMRNHVRVVRPGGYLFYAVPNGGNPASWDYGRELTNFEHLVRDDREGPEGSRRHHYWEWVCFAGKRTDPQAIDAEVARLMSMNYSIHFHVWSHLTFFGFLDRAIEYNALPVSVQHFECNDYETIAILQVTP